MLLTHYDLSVSSDGLLYTFVSSGPKGAIRKVAVLTPFDEYYNLGFGDWNDASDTVDDTVVTDNGDADKVFATIAAIVGYFTTLHPRAKIYIEGNTAARTRLYQMQISRNFNWLSDDFAIFGRKDDRWLPFAKDIQYNAFYAICKG